MEHLKEVIIEYLNTPKTDYALMINGEWGCGKTYYFKNEIIKDNEIEISSDKKYKVIYVSLNGISDVEEINKTIVSEIIGSKNGLKIGSAVLTTALKFLKIDHLKESFDINDFFDLSTTVLCFDDLERVCSQIKIEDVLGYISTNFVEHKHVKTIFIANEDELKEQSEPKYYHRIKEKLINRVLNFELNVEKIVKEIIDKYSESNKEFYAFINSEQTFFIKVINEYEQKNLRTILFCLQILERVFNSVNDEKKGLFNEVANQIILFIVVISFEFKDGRLKSSEYDDYRGLNLIDQDFQKLDIKEIVNIPISNTVSKDELLEIDDKPTYAESFYAKYLKNKYIVSYVFFKSIYRFILTGYLDQKLLNRELTIKDKKEQGSIVKESEESITLNKIYDFSKLPNNEFDLQVKKFIKFIEEGRYNLYLYPNLLSLIEHFKEKQILKITPEEIDRIFETALEKSKSITEPDEDQIERYKVFRTNNKRVKALEEDVEKAHSEIIKIKAKNEFDKLGKEISSGEKPIKEIFNKYSLKPVFYAIDVRAFSQYLIKTSNENLSEFYHVMRGRYNSSNIGDFLAADSDNLVELKNILKEHIGSNSLEGINGYHLRNILDLLDDIIKKLVNKENRELA